MHEELIEVFSNAPPDRRDVLANAELRREYARVTGTQDASANEPTGRSIGRCIFIIFYTHTRIGNRLTYATRVFIPFCVLCTRRGGSVQSRCVTLISLVCIPLSFLRSLSFCFHSFPNIILLAVWFVFGAFSSKLYIFSKKSCENQTKAHRSRRRVSDLLRGDGREGTARVVSGPVWKQHPHLMLCRGL